jgi:hypothetical protein
VPQSFSPARARISTAATDSLQGFVDPATCTEPEAAMVYGPKADPKRNSSVQVIVAREAAVSPEGRVRLFVDVTPQSDFTCFFISEVVEEDYELFERAVVIPTAMPRCPGVLEVNITAIL